MEEVRKEHVIIIGGGPAGLTAAIYVSRGGIPPLVIGGYSFGGQLMFADQVENFPGFPRGISGPDLIKRMEEQAMKFGARIIKKDVTKVNFLKKPFSIYVEDEEFLADIVIVATGSSPKELGLKSEKKLRGKGVSYCAVCDGPLFKEKDVVVVGGGDVAIEEALFLAKLANSVTVIHRRGELRAAAILQKRAFENPKISFLWNSIVDDIVGEERVEGVKVRNVKTGEERFISCSGVFIAIGYKPNTDLFRNQLELDKMGYIKVFNETRSSIEGVFVAGDVADSRYRQAITATASGCKAALDALDYLRNIRA